MTPVASPARNTQLIPQSPSTDGNSPFMEPRALSQVRGNFETISPKRLSTRRSSTPPLFSYGKEK